MIRSNSLTGIPLYGTDNNGDYGRIAENHLVEAEMSVKTSDDEIISFNTLVSRLTDGSISDFRKELKDKEHEEINDTPVTTQDEEGGVIGAIRRALRWIVTLLNKLFSIVSRLGK